MDLTVLGCGDAFGNGGRFNTSFLLSHENEYVLLDCGASTLIRLKELGINLENISTIIISHFHGDHYGGLPFFLISSLFENPRKNPLTIVGPEGIEDRVFNLQEAMYVGSSDKIHEMDIRFIEFTTGESQRIGEMSLIAYQVEHSPPSNPHAYRLEWQNKKIAFSGDTSWTDSLIDLSENTDLFICECNFIHGVSFGHLSVEELKENAGLFKTKSLWLTHMNDEVYNHPEIGFQRMYDGLNLTIK